MSNVLHVNALSGYEPEIGRWLWALEEARCQTLASIREMSQQTLDWTGSNGTESSIGTLLYHIALVEMSWLFFDIYEREFPSEVKTLFPHTMATEGRLTNVSSDSLEEHVTRLNESRRIFLESLEGMSLADWHRPRAPKDMPYEVTPAWVAFHLIEHEAGHAAQIRVLKKRSNQE